MTIAANIDGSLDAKNIVMGVLQKGVEYSNLLSAIKTTVQVPKLNAVVPVMTTGSVTTDVAELVETDIEGASFTNVSFDLKKDRVKLAISDEAEYRSMTGNPLEIQKQGAGVRLGAALDAKIITALETDAMGGATGGIWSTVTNSPLIDLGTAAANIKAYGYTADFCIMTPHTFGHYIGNDLIKYIGMGNPASMKGAIATVPGLELNIFVNSGITANTCIVGSSDGMAAVLGNGPVKVRSWDSPHNGATIYQMDVYRQVKAPIFTNDSGDNMACYILTGVTS